MRRGVFRIIPELPERPDGIPSGHRPSQSLVLYEVLRISNFEYPHVTFYKKRHSEVSNPKPASPPTQHDTTEAASRRDKTMKMQFVYKGSF